MERGPEKIRPAAAGVTGAWASFFAFLLFFPCISSIELFKPGIELGVVLENQQQGGDHRNFFLPLGGDPGFVEPLGSQAGQRNVEEGLG